MFIDAKHPRCRLALTLLAASTLVACQPQGATGTQGQDAPASAPPPKPVAAVTGDTVEFAVAHLRPTAGNAATGTVRFSATANGVRVVSELEGLPAGAHAHHVHVWGDCSGADGKTAGTHYNFSGSTLNLPDDAKKRITGDLGDLTAGEDGTARASTLVQRATLNGPLSVLGRAVIVHAKGNDPSQPPIGAAGARLACGVIGATPASS